MKGDHSRDDLLRFLCDARLRANPPQDFLLEPEKARRMARFLARRYYRGCFNRSFRFTQGFAAQTGRVAADVLSGSQFEQFVEESVLGSFDSARRVGVMAVVHLDAAQHPGPWWRDLVEYECACFLQEATSEQVARIRRHRRAASAVCRTFAWWLPGVLEHLRAGRPASGDLRRECTLLFSRSAGGRPVVVELERDAASVFRSTNGYRTPEQIASAAAVPLDQAAGVLEQLVEVGAIKPPA
ncbi:MAG: hypothetical protein ACRD2R_04970 [Terriglobales bacterium]